MDLGNVNIKLINTSSKTLEAMLKILEDLQEFQDTMTIKHRRKDARKRRRTVVMDNHKKIFGYDGSRSPELRIHIVLPTERFCKHLKLFML